jgi:hypothetical protein
MNAPKLAIVLLSSRAALSMAPYANAATDPEAIVQAQLEAYNAHDIDAFVATYADDAQIFEHPAKLLAAGPAQLRERYTARFKEPNLRAVVAKRIVMGNMVIDHERVTRTFPEGPGMLEAVAIYEVQSGKIAKVWLVMGPKTLNTRQ